MHHRNHISLHSEPSIPFYGRFSVQKWPLLGCFLLFSGRSSWRFRSIAAMPSRMKAVVLSWRLGYQGMANGCSIRHVPRRGATQWPILR